MQPTASTYWGEGKQENQKGGCASRTAALRKGVSAYISHPLPAVFAICALFGLHRETDAGVGAGALRLYCAGTVFAKISILMAGYFQVCGAYPAQASSAAVRAIAAPAAFRP